MNKNNYVRKSRRMQTCNLNQIELGMKECNLIYIKAYFITNSVTFSNNKLWTL